MSQGAGTQPAFSNEQIRLLQEIADNVKITNVKLFGSSDADTENTTGRLPKVEQSAKKAHERLDKLDKRIFWVSGFAAGIGAIVAPYVEKVFK